MTNNCDWSIHKDLKALPRAQYLVLDVAGQIRRRQERRACHRQDAACLRRHRLQAAPLEIERYLRDGKAGWVMGPTNEVLRQFVGKAALLGFGALDYWNQAINERVLNNEIKKMSPEKQALAKRLMSDATAGKAAQ